MPNPQDKTSPGYLYLPMEVAVRELDSRLLIALVAVERGMEVIMGQKWLMEKNIEAMPPGLWIFKTMTRRDSKRMARCKAAGHMVVSIDEEVPAMAEGSGGLLWVSEAAVLLCDRIFCLGEEHRKSLAEKWPAIEKRLLLTGNPRWDYLRPELASLYGALAKTYNERYGRIILVNTNTGNANPAKKQPDEVLRDYIKDKKIDPNDTRHMAFWNELIAFEEANLAATMPLVKRLSREFPDHTILLRPHPSERMATYTDALKGLKNVEVLFEGSAAPWILASDVLVHTCCTTGLEAFALGKPSVSYGPVPNRTHDLLLSDRLSFTANSEDGVLAEVHRIVEGRLDGSAYPAQMTQTFGRFFSAQRGPLAVERVVAAVQDIMGLSPSNARTGETARWRPFWNYKPWWPQKAYNRRMFPPVDVATVKSRLQLLATVLGHKSSPAFVECGDGVLHLYPAALSAPKPAGTWLARAIHHLAGKKPNRVAAALSSRD
jgi:surface carbohydrate biosynthesis protein